MSWGYNPFITSQSPYHGAYLAVVESIAKLIATGASFEDVYLTFQEYFEKPGKDPSRWGKPLAALLGAFMAQKDFGVGAIGGKDSMSGSFEKLDVPPTLVSFAVTTGNVDEVITNEFKEAGHKVYLLAPKYTNDSLPDPQSEIALFNKVTKLMRDGKVFAAYTLGYGGIAEAVAKMCMGNGFGFKYNDALELKDIFGYKYGAFIIETKDEVKDAVLVGEILKDEKIEYRASSMDFKALCKLYEDKLEDVYPINTKTEVLKYEAFSFDAKERYTTNLKVSKPRVLIPVFPGTNCEYDSAKVMLDAGAEVKTFIINNLTQEGISRSVDHFVDEIKESQMIFIPGGFSGGDEPDGSAKFIMSFFRNEAIKSEVHDLLNKRDGLMCGICNGFQALIKLGLVPYGKIIDTDATCPTLTFNTIARHQSKLVRIRIASNKSPWLRGTNVGDIFTVPISHGEGRFLSNDSFIKELAKNGQIATQYVDLNGNPTSDIQYNPNNSMYAIEGITSPDGRVFGKMGHSERIGYGLYKNVYGIYDMKMFESAVKYFKGN